MSSLDELKALKEVVESLENQERVKEAMRYQLAKLLAACKDALEHLEYASFEYANGNTHNGIDEGNVIGWKAHGELIEELREAIKNAEV